MNPTENKPMKPRKRIRPRSKAMEAKMKVYRAEVAAWLKLPENRQCAVYPKKKATQCHHSKGRNGPLLMDKRWWKPVSMAGHQRIGDNPEEARANGWLCQRGKWNNPRE